MVLASFASQELCHAAGVAEVCKKSKGINELQWVCRARGGVPGVGTAALRAKAVALAAAL